MSALKARLYEPDPPKKPERSILDLFKGMASPNEALSWPELHQGNRGLGVSLVRLKGARDLSVGLSGDPGGGYLLNVGQAPTIIEATGAVTIASRMGVQFRPTANFYTIPRETAEVTLEWITEGVAPTGGDPTFGILRPSMKTGSVTVDFTRLLELQGTPLVDTILTSMFLRAIGRGVDHTIFHGPGTGGAPTGIAATADVSVQDGSTFTIAKAAALLKAVEDGGADTPSVSFAMDPATAEKLRTRPRAVSGGEMLFEDGKILDRPAHVSTSINAATIFCGSFPDVLVLVREVELLFNPYTQGRPGIRELIGFWHGDVIVQHAGYFALATGVS